MSVPPAPPLLLASTSPQRRAILEQLGIPFDVVAPRYDEDDREDADPVDLVRRHALGKARSVADGAGDRPVLAVDTAVALDGRVYGKPRGRRRRGADARGAGGPDARRRLRALPRHARVGARRPRGDARRRSGRSPPRDLAAYVATGEWAGRAGAYAIQGRGGALVERIEGDYLNVVGLPGALLVRLLAERFAGVYGFG